MDLITIKCSNVHTYIQKIEHALLALDKLPIKKRVWTKRKNENYTSNKFFSFAHVIVYSIEYKIPVKTLKTKSIKPMLIYQNYITGHGLST